MKIGFIGCGSLGLAIIKKIYQGWDELSISNFYVYNRTMRKAYDLQKKIERIEICTDICDILGKSEIIFICTSSNKFLLEFDIEDHDLSSKIIINLSTINPTESESLYSNLKLHNVDYYECAVSGGPEGASTGRLTAIISGNVIRYNEVNALIKSFSSKVIYIDKPLKVQQLKILNNYAEAVNLYVAADIIAIGRKIGLKMNDMYHVFSSARGRSTYMMLLLDRLRQNNSEVNVSLAIRNKDISLMKLLTEQNLIYSELLNITQKMFIDASEDFSEDDDQCTCLKYLQSLI